ncbi:hypothetical protein LEMLEM_LOCUS15226 [Lemmus lemmus]
MNTKRLGHTRSRVFSPRPPLELGSGGERVLSHESWRNRGAKRLGQAPSPQTPTSSWDPSRSPKVTWSGDRRATLQARERRLEDAHPRFLRNTRRCGVGAAGEVGDAPGKSCSPGPQPQDARSRAAPSPARVPFPRRRETRHHLGESGLWTGRSPRRPPAPPIGSRPGARTAVGAGRDAREGGFQTGGEGGGRGQEKPLSITGHAPRPPTPITAVVRPKWAGPCALRPWETALRQPVGRRIDRRGVARAHASSGANRGEAQPSTSGRRGWGGQDGGGHGDLAAVRAA